MLAKAVQQKFNKKWLTGYISNYYTIKM